MQVWAALDLVMVEAITTRLSHRSFAEAWSSLFQEWQALPTQTPMQQTGGLKVSNMCDIYWSSSIGAAQFSPRKQGPTPKDSMLLIGIGTGLQELPCGIHIQ